MKRFLRILVVLALLAGLGYAAWRYYPELVKREAVPPVYQGYVEGEFVQVSAPVSGRLDVLNVERGDAVKAGQPLFELEAEYDKAALRAAEADRDSAKALLADMRTGKRPEEIEAMQAQLEQIQAVEKDTAIQLERDLELYRRGAVAKSQVDKSQAEEDANLAKIRELQTNIVVGRLPDRADRIAAQAEAVKTAEAKVRQAEWTLDHKRIASTRDGRVYDVVFRRGEWVPAGQPVIRILPPENIKIRFYVPETVLATFRVGQKVRVGRDGAESFAATVSYISADAEFTPPVIYSNESRYKLSFMIEARPAASIAVTLNPGQPVYVGLE